jgi:hypothetical protein
LVPNVDGSEAQDFFAASVPATDVILFLSFFLSFFLSLKYLPLAHETL